MIVASGSGWVYCLQANKGGAGIYYFKGNRPSRKPPLMYAGGGYTGTWTLVAATNFVFEVQHNSGYLGVFSATPGNATPVLINWLPKIDGLAGVTMIPDNTRFYTLGSYEVGVWQAYLIKSK